MDNSKVKDSVASIYVLDRLTELPFFLNRLLSRKHNHRKKVLFFYPHNISMPRTGAHARAYQLISCLRELGLDVLLFSSTLFTDIPWDKASVGLLQKQLGISVYVHKATSADIEFIAINGADWQRFTPPDMSSSFKIIATKYNADVLVINYAMWGKLASVVPFIPLKIIEMIDIWTLNSKMQNIIREEIGTFPLDPWLVDIKFLQEDFYTRAGISPDESEYRVYDTFDVTIAISPTECELVKANTRQTKVVYLPMMVSTEDMPKRDYNSEPIFVIGVNMLNFQGYLYFVRRILPSILDKNPGFSLEVYGDGCNYLKESAGIMFKGFVPDLDSIYSCAPFAVCPLLGGTGQQVKVIEAMAHGVPVVVMKNVAGSSPIVHGVNGFIATTADEFVEYCLLLYEDRELCKSMGLAARDTILDSHSHERMRNELLNIFRGLKSPRWWF